MRIISLLSLLIIFILFCNINYSYSDSDFLDDPLSDDDLFPEDDIIDDDNIEIINNNNNNNEINNNNNINNNNKQQEQQHEEEIITKNNIEFLDTDEFVGIPIKSSNKKSSLKEREHNSNSNNNNNNNNNKENLNKKNENENNNIYDPMDYIYEMFGLLFISIYLVNYFIGSSTNVKLATTWMSMYKDLFEQQFAVLGAYDDREEVKSLLLKDSEDTYKFYSSGRRNCKGLLATLELVQRQDLFSLFLGQLGMTHTKDMITIDIPMNDDDMEPFVLAVMKRKDEHKLRKSIQDLEQFGKLVSSKNLPSSLSLVTDTSSIENIILDNKVCSVLDKHIDLFHLIHITDQNFRSFSTSKHNLRFKFYLPSVKKMHQLEKLLKLALYLIDIVAEVRLSRSDKERALKKRATLEAEKRKATHEQRQEEAMRRKDKKKRKEEEAFENLSAEAQRKKEERDYRRSLKKKGPKVKRLR